MTTSLPTPDAIPPRTPRRPLRLVLLVAAGVLVIFAGLGYRHYWYDHPIGTGPAGPSVSKERFTKPWSTRPVLLLGFGDSVTAGYGASPRHSYFDLIAANPEDEFPDMQGISLKQVLPNLRTKNIALSGSTSLEHLDVLISKIEMQDADTFGIVVLTTGGNDVIHNYGRTPPREGAMYGATLDEARPWIENFTARLDTILDKIAAKFPGGCQFYLANIYDPTDDVGDTEHAGLPAWPGGRQVLGAYNKVLADCAARRDDVDLIDMHGTFLGHGIHCLKFWNPHYHADDPHYWYFDNLEDPNNRGYDALRRLFLIEMAKTLLAKIQPM